MSLRHAILGLLYRRPASGYDLLKTFNESLAHVWPATQSQLYTELGHLTSSGLVVVRSEGPRGRKEYGLTEAGDAELHHWLVDVEPEPPRRNDALLRMFFFDRLDTSEARTYLEKRAVVAGRQQAALIAVSEQTERDGGPLSTYGLITLEFGVRLAEMTREWAEWASEQLPTISRPETRQDEETG